MYGYIYLTTNLINNRKYIGQHKSEKFDKKYRGSGQILKQAFDKYGKDNFETIILEECNSREELNEKEKFWIKEYNAVYSDEYYNIAFGGGSRHGPLAEEQKRYLSEIAKQRVGEKNPFYGRHHSDETKKKISEAGHRRDPSTFIGANKGKFIINNGKIEKFVESLDNIPEGFQIGRKPFSKEHCELISKTHKGKKLSEETKKKLSEANRGINNCWYGKHLPEEARKKMSETHKKLYEEEPERKAEISKNISERNIGRFWINNGKINKFIDKEEFVELEKQGFVKGRLLKNEWHTGAIFITNGKENKLIKNEDEIPKGWTKGMTRHKN